uniref:Uncharacterized protein n=1 Tax=Caenorhabditis japonica TaxID=281687 RepID=A0A8R1DYC1_CAEJA
MEHIVKSKDINARNTPSPAPGELPQPQSTNSSKLSTTTIRNELWRLHKAFSKSSKPDDELIKRIKSKTEELITFVFKSVEALRSKMTSMNGDGSMRKKYNVQKRKLDSLTDASVPLLKRIAEQFSVASATKMTMATDGVTSSTSSTAVLPPAPKLAGSGSATKQPTLSALSSSSSFPYLPLSDSDDDDDVQCIDPAPPAKKAAPSILQKPAATKPTPPGQQNIQIQNTPTSLTTVVQKPGTSSAKVLKPATTSFTVQKPASLPSTVQKPTTSTSNAPQKPAALYSKVQKPPTSSAAQPNVAMALLTGMASTDPSTRLYATQALQTLQAAHAAHAAKSAQEAQVAKMVQALQAEQAAAKEAKRLKAAQARAVQQVQAVQAQFMAQLVSAATATAPVVRPTPARPNPAPKPRPKPQQQPQQQQQQPQPQQRPSLVGKPPTSSPVRPTPVRPNAPSTSSNNNMTAASTAQQRFETLQFLNSIPDPAMKERLIQQLFLDPHEIHEQWKWRIMPFRMAVDAQEHEPVPHFQLATTLYQLASSLARFYRYLPETDARKPAADDTEISALRFESRDQFDRCLELTKLGDDGSQPEHQWLCYFFIGKLESKSAKCDVVKVVESFYEAACGCELAGFYYPQKVQTKKQTNFEPIEVHYQVFSAVYKYLIRRKEYPSLEVLRKLRVLLKVMQDGHKVAKPNSSLFKFNLEICSIVDSLVCDTVQNEKKRNNEVHSMETQKEAVDELKKFCFNAFTLITDRFPHIKAYYRLAQIAMEQSNSIDTASEHIFKNVFKRKKRDDGMFENVVEISCNDISRYGSHQFHISRCLQLGVQIAQRLQDLHNVVAILVAMVNAVTKEDE